MKRRLSQIGEPNFVSRDGGKTVALVTLLHATAVPSPCLNLMLLVWSLLLC